MRSRDTCAREPRASASDHSSEGGNAPSRSRLVSYPNAFAGYVRLRAARVSKRSLIRGRKRSLTVAARKLPKYVRAIRAPASRARQQAITNQSAKRSLTVAARKLPKCVRAIRAPASRARQQAITHQRAETLPHGRGS